MIQAVNKTEHIFTRIGFITMELNITELRKQRRPLWMSDLDTDDYADFLGGGGDIYTDRLPPAWERHSGLEISEDELQEITAGGLIRSPASKAVV